MELISLIKKISRCLWNDFIISYNIRDTLLLWSHDFRTKSFVLSSIYTVLTSFLLQGREAQRLQHTPCMPMSQVLISAGMFYRDLSVRCYILLKSDVESMNLFFFCRYADVFLLIVQHGGWNHRFQWARQQWLCVGSLH